MSKRPFMKFFPNDWFGDVPLRSCSIAARGLWIEMLCIMHSARPAGYLDINDRPMGEVMLAAQTNVAPAEVVELLAELEAAQVFSRRESDGAIYSRKMLRDAEKSARARAFGLTGGNPQLITQDDRRVKGRVNGGVKPHGDKPHGIWNMASPRGRTPKGEELGTDTPAPDDAGERDGFDTDAPFGRDPLARGGRH